VVNYQGLAIQFTRAPDVGDVFEVDGNHDGLGNNENMLIMADLSKKGVIGNKSFSDSYIDQVNTVGNAAQQAKITQQALTVVNDQAKQSLQQSELQRARDVWRKKYDQPAIDAAGRVRQMRFLAGRGFSIEVVRRVVTGIDPPDGDDPEADSS
jgi:SOS response regulatory protein OraA/RecX